MREVVMISFVPSYFKIGAKINTCNITIRVPNVVSLNFIDFFGNTLRNVKFLLEFKLMPLILSQSRKNKQRDKIVLLFNACINPLFRIKSYQRHTSKVIRILKSLFSISSENTRCVKNLDP